MIFSNRLITVATTLVATLILSSTALASVNKSVKIAVGETASGASSVNGSVSVGANAFVNGTVETVNGSIKIGDNAQIEDAETVNGGIKIGSGVRAQNVSSVNGSVTLGQSTTVDGEVSVVNGKISLASGSEVSRSVSNVNGDIKISGARIGGDLTTVMGDVTLEDNALLAGDLRIEEPQRSSSYGRNSKPKIVIGPGATVEGDIIIEHEVELYISDSATFGEISGVMNLDDAVRFQGSRP